MKDPICGHRHSFDVPVPNVGKQCDKPATVFYVIPLAIFEDRKGTLPPELADSSTCHARCADHQLGTEERYFRVDKETYLAAEVMES